MEYSQEIWRPIKNYEHYLISNKGNVFSLNSKPPKIKNLQTNERGYNIVQLQKNSKRKMFKVHRLVASAFIPNPNNKPQVNHKDYNPKNNNVENLEWCTPKENINYSSCNMHGIKIYKTKTGEHHITFNEKTNKYKVVFGGRGKRKQKYFFNLEDAVKYRDENLI